MKKIVYEDILDFDKLLEEYKTIRSKTKHKEKIYKYELYLGTNLLNLLNQLKYNKYHHQSYNIFIIKEPKYRIIMSEKMNDKIVNHLISNNVLIPLIEPLLIDSNVATRINKGTSYGLKLALKYINKLKLNYDNVYALKIDIKKYFFNIDHQILLTKLHKIITDEKLFYLINHIITSSDGKYVNDDIIKEQKKLIKNISLKNIKDKNIHIKSILDLPLYKEGKGLPIGNLSSQILAIYYLNDVDHFIKEKLKMKYYIRYMDDFIIFHHDKNCLKEILKQIIPQMKKLKLEINNKTNIYDFHHGVSFLGYNFKLVGKKLIIRINNSTKKRIKKKIKNLKKYDKEKLILVKASYKGYLSFSNTNTQHFLSED